RGAGKPAPVPQIDKEQIKKWSSIGCQAADEISGLEQPGEPAAGRREVPGQPVPAAVARLRESASDPAVVIEGDDDRQAGPLPRLELVVAGGGPAPTP